MVAASDSDSLPPLSCRLSDVQGGHGRGGILAGPRASRDPPAGPSCLRAVQGDDAQGGEPSSGLHRETVKAIDQAMMEKVQSERPLDEIDVLGFDEIAAGKGQSYWTLICAPRGRNFFFSWKATKSKDLTTFWSWFGKERAQKVTPAVVDMWPAFRKSFWLIVSRGKSSMTNST